MKKSERLAEAEESKPEPVVLPATPSAAMEDKAVQEITKRTMVPEMLQPQGEYTILGQIVKTRPLPNAYAWRLFELASPMLNTLSSLVTVDMADLQALTEAQAEVRAKSPDAERQLNALMLDAMKVICEFYGVAPRPGVQLAQAIRDEMSTGEMVEIIRNQTQLNGLADFLLQPLRLIFGMFDTLTYLMTPTAVPIQEYRKQVALQQSSGPSPSLGDSPPSD